MPSKKEFIDKMTKHMDSMLDIVLMESLSLIEKIASYEITEKDKVSNMRAVQAIFSNPPPKSIAKQLNKSVPPKQLTTNINRKPLTKPNNAPAALRRPVTQVMQQKPNQSISMRTGTIEKRPRSVLNATGQLPQAKRPHYKAHQRRIPTEQEVNKRHEREDSLIDINSSFQASWVNEEIPLMPPSSPVNRNCILPMYLNKIFM